MCRGNQINFGNYSFLFVSVLKFNMIMKNIKIFAASTTEWGRNKMR
jgi:hypothetical protein